MLSILSWNFYTRLGFGGRSSLRPCGLRLVSAGEDPIEVLGQTTVGLEVGGRRIDQRFLVAKVGGHGIIGMDFLTSQGCVLDIPGGCMKWSQGEVPVSTLDTDRVDCCKVVLSETITVPAHSEMIAEGRLTRNVSRQKYGVVEPNLEFKGGNPLLMAAGLASPTDRRVPLRLLNPGMEPVTACKGTVTALYSTIEAFGLPYSNRRNMTDRHRGKTR